MGYPKFYATYCVMDMDAGANPFGHSCLIISRQENENGPTKVLDAVGHYSQPSTTTNPVVKVGKHILGFPIDLQEGHGVLIQESMRYLNGNGLKGISFELTHEQFDNLIKSYTKAMQDEQEAIEQFNIKLANLGSPVNGFTRHLAAKEEAETLARPPRLKPFHVEMDLTLDSRTSYNCKHRALDFLQEQNIIDDAIRAKILSNKTEHAFPRFSRLRLTPIRLISTGEPERCESKSKKGQVYHNHVWTKNRMYWATPVVTLDHIANPHFDIEHYSALKKMLNRIAAMEQKLHAAIDSLDKVDNVEDNFARLKRHRNQALLKIQLKRVQNLAYVFHNNVENQNHLQDKLDTADKVLNSALLALEPERINAPFLLRAYESMAMKNALTGFFAIMVSAALLLVVPPVGIVLGVLASIATGRELYGFYKEEKARSQALEDYQESCSPNATILNPA